MVLFVTGTEPWPARAYIGMGVRIGTRCSRKRLTVAAGRVRLETFGSAWEQQTAWPSNANERTHATQGDTTEKG